MGTKIYEILIEDNMLCPDGRPIFDEYAKVYLSATSHDEAKKKVNDQVLTLLFNRKILHIKELRNVHEFFLNYSKKC
jgi:hypothetical protein